MEDLFLDSELTFEKVAAEAELPEDANAWPQEILQELYKQVPYISEFDPQIVMDRVDAEKGYGFGHVEVSSKTEIPSSNEEAMAAGGVRTAKIPIIVSARKLQPFDVIVTDGSKMLPLTESRLRQAMFRPELFDVTSKGPGDHSMISQLYPPFRQGMGMGGGMTMGADMGKTAMDKEAIGMKTVGNYLKAQKDPARLANFSRLATSRGAQLATQGGDAADKGRKLLSAGTIAAQRATKTASSLNETGGEYVNDANRLRGAAVGALGGGAPGDWLGVLKQASAGLLSAVVSSARQSDLEKVAGAILDPSIQASFLKNKHASKSALSTILTAEVTKVASVEDLVRPTVAHVQRGDFGGYVVKTANADFWEPKTELLDRGQLVERFGYKVALAADTSEEGVMMAEGAPEATPAPQGAAVAGAPAVSSEEDEPSLIKDYGLYKVQTDDGQELVGYVFPNLLDLDGTVLPLALFTNGSQAAVQGEIVGVRAGEGQSLPQGGRPRGHGCFYRVLPNGKAEATLPMDINASLSMGGDATFMAETFDGQQVEVAGFQPNLQAITQIDGKVLIPETFRWLPLDRAAEVSLVSDPLMVNKEASIAQSLASVTVRANDGLFTVDGPALDKVASDQKSFLGLEDTLFLLAGLGVPQSYAQEKLGHAMIISAPVSIPVSRSIKTAGDARREAVKLASETLAQIPSLRRNLVKEASVIPDPTAVDTVLSLGFIHPENIVVFMEAMPVIDAAQEKLCELLVASRLGLREVPSAALENAIRNMEEVLEGLKVIAFQNN